ncbi:MAG: DUF1295 domain-containing protein [Candidatus Saccharimonadales bacterium]
MNIIPKLLVISAVSLLLYMTMWFMFAKSRKRLDSIDTAWGLGFVVVALVVLAQVPTKRTSLVALLVSIWGIRLAAHIWRRSVRRKNEDPRYLELSSKWKDHYWRRAYTSLFLLQGSLIWIVSLPIVLTAGTIKPELSWLSLLGSAIWLVGFSIESIADRQLANYLKVQDRPKVLSSGLWHYSRHPNYFGELTQWWGIGIIGLQANFGYVGLIGPLVLSILIIKISGIPPIEKRRSKDFEYRQYQRTTNAIIPWVKNPHSTLK